MTNPAQDESGGDSAKRVLALDARLAEIVVRPLARTPVSPNMLTVAGVLIGVSAAWLFSTGETAAANWGGLLFMVAVFMDHVDGAHARSTGKTSRFGHYLDHFGAATSYSVGFAGIGIGRPDVLGGWGVELGIAAAVSVMVIFSVRIVVEERHGSAVVTQTPRGGFEIEDTLYLIGPVAWLGGLEPFIVAAGIGTPLFLIWVLWETYTVFRAGNGDQSVP